MPRVIFGTNPKRLEESDQFTYPWGHSWWNKGFRFRNRAPYKRRRFRREQLKILDAVIAGRSVNHGIPQTRWQDEQIQFPARFPG